MGASEFDSFYQEQWGNRWPLLREALTLNEIQVARHNLFSDANLSGLKAFRPADFPECYEVSPEIRAQIPRGSENLLSYYILDPASQWAARSLDVQSGDSVLDMCAAPGGKTLVLIEALANEGEILANEPSPARRERLMGIIRQYVPRDVRDRVRVTGKEGGLFSKTHPNTFDRILIDAPCSGERHLLENAKEMEQWSAARTSKLAQTQYALLSGGLEALKPGGHLVYSTCSVSRMENDEVVRRILKKKKERLVLEELVAPEGAEKTEFGVFFLPDRCGFGPLYVSRLRKAEET